MAASALITRARAIPWLAVYGAAKWLYEKGRDFWENLTPSERGELGRLVRKSKGRRGNITDKEFDRLRTLVKKGFTGKR
jgi:hypothetical protein